MHVWVGGSRRSVPSSLARGCFEQGAERSPAAVAVALVSTPPTQNKNAQAFCSALRLVLSFAFLPSIILRFRLSHPPQQGLWHWQFFSWAP